jgi:hypothetical protein
VLDGLIRYGDDYVIVMESKLSETFEDLYQASNLIFIGQLIQFEGLCYNYYLARRSGLLLQSGRPKTSFNF